MSIDSLIANPGRLKILTALAGDPRQEFVQLRSTTRMTDGNLATHARRLHSAGLVGIDKAFREGKPVTTFTLTPEGRGALENHVQYLTEALDTHRQKPAVSPTTSHEVAISTASNDDDNWVD